MKTSDQLDKLSTALSKFQGEISNVKNDSINPFFKSKYSDLATIWKSIRPHLSANLLSIIQDASASEDGVVSVCTRLMHSSGQWIECGPLRIVPAKKDAHGSGSAITYAKRYTLTAVLGITSDNEDDDGNASIAKPSGQRKYSPPPPVQKAKHPKACSPVDVDLWYEKMGDKYSNSELSDYVSDNCRVLESTEKDTIAYLSTIEDEKFELSINRWRKGQEESSPKKKKKK